MPAASAKTEEREEKLWLAIKRHIQRERQKKAKQQEEAEEEERQRKEREEKIKENVMTLGETKEQIQTLEQKLETLRKEKQELFLQLKKVLNEDDIRKRQLHKESAEMFALHNMQQGPQIFLPPRVSHPPTLLHKAQGPHVGMTPIKRNRSPSPTQGYYKHATQQYSLGPKMEEGRRANEAGRAVLWNKPAQYANPPGTLFYPTTQPNPVLYTPYQNLNIPMQGGKISAQPPANVYHINLDSGPPPKPHQQGPPMTIEKLPDRSPYHHEMQKHDDRKDVRGSQPPSHLPEGMVYSTTLRPGQIPLHTMTLAPGQGPQGGKQGSITQGYPQVRPGAQPPPPQQHYPRHHRY